jgi:hypothetical protein
MRLLLLGQDGHPSLTKDLVEDIPPYAILSHTWAGDDDECTFKDINEGTGKEKTGFRKIQFCGKQAASDGLKHFWVDTCCIDKADFTELSTAINSMFRWYQRATKCYVYLSDVSKDEHTLVDVSSIGQWESSFMASRWFTRGWTLQELIAPTSLEFFSMEGHRLSDRRSLVPHLSKITGIPEKILQGGPLNECTIEERISWSRYRTTKREEDRAYSLLGILGINMPLIYGEELENAFLRLRFEAAKKYPSATRVHSPSSERCKHTISSTISGLY